MNAAAATAINPTAIASSSSRSAPETRFSWSPQEMMKRVAVTASTARVREGTARFVRSKTPARRTTQIPAVRAMIGAMPE